MPGMLQQANSQQQQPAEGGDIPPEIARALAQQNGGENAQEGAAPQEDVAPKQTPEGPAPKEPSLGGSMEQATAAEQKDYERAMRALTKILYLDDKTSSDIADMLTPEDKIGSIVKASILLVSQLDDKIDMTETIIPQITLEVVARVSEMGEAQYEDEMMLTEKEAQAALGATWEGIMEIYGVDAEGVQAAEAGIDDSTKAALKQQWEGALNG